MLSVMGPPGGYFIDQVTKVKCFTSEQSGPFYKMFLLLNKALLQKNKSLRREQN